MSILHSKGEGSSRLQTGILNQMTTFPQLFFAVLIMVSVAVVTIVTLPEENRQLPVVQPFLPMFAVAVFLIEGLTAYLLGIQFRATDTNG
jgi:hypothetical protein